MKTLELQMLEKVQLFAASYLIHNSENAISKFSREIFLRAVIVAIENTENLPENQWDYYYSKLSITKGSGKYELLNKLGDMMAIPKPLSAELLDGGLRCICATLNFHLLEDKDVNDTFNEIWQLLAPLLLVLYMAYEKIDISYLTD